MLFRSRVLLTLRGVRIHITDPRPYTRRLDSSLLCALNGLTLQRFIEKLEQAEARHLKHVRRRFIASQMLSDSPAERLKRLYIAWEYAAGLRIDASILPDDLKPISRSVRRAPSIFPDSSAKPRVSSTMCLPRFRNPAPYFPALLMLSTKP